MSFVRLHHRVRTHLPQNRAALFHLELASLACLALASCGDVVSKLAAERNATGDGTAENPYRIYTAAQLDAVRNDLAAHYRLMADIDLSGYAAGEGWVPLGDSKTPFTGSLDGNGRTISKLTINRNADYQGLFGSNFGISAVTKDSSFSGEVIGSKGVGGLIGICAGTIERSSSVAKVSGDSIPKTTSEMQQRSTFIDWDFDTVWGINEGTSYPYLRREGE